MATVTLSARIDTLQPLGMGALAGVGGAAAPAPIVMEAGLELEEAPGAARRPLLKLRVPSPVPG